MLKQYNKILSTIILISIASILLFGCTNSKLKQTLELGIKNLNSGNYKKAESDFKNVLNQDKENSEAKKLLNIVINYDKAKQNFAKDDLNSTKDFIKKIPSDYTNYKIKDDIENLNNQVKMRLNNIEKINIELDDANKLLINNKLDEALIKIKNIDMKYAKEEQKQKLNNLNKDINKKIDQQKEIKNQSDIEQKKKIENEKKHTNNIRKKIVKNTPKKRNKEFTKSEAIAIAKWFYGDYKMYYTVISELKHDKQGIGYYTVEQRYSDTKKLMSIENIFADNSTILKWSVFQENLYKNGKIPQIRDYGDRPIKKK